MKYFLEDINKRVKANAEKFVFFCESEFYERVKVVAKRIIENRMERPIVLISGPSGSGKTTTALLLEQYLEHEGYTAHTISLDNYYREFSDEEYILSKQGKIELEAPSRLDIQFLNNELSLLLQYKEVEIPKYNFTLCKREYIGCKIKRKEGDIIIFEGTHALNPSVIKIDDKFTTPIFVGARSSVAFSDMLLSSQRIRLTRRMLRDNSTRNHTIEQTLSLFDKVNEGEAVFIKPYISRCVESIDTFIPYELNLYRDLLFDKLLKYEGNKEVDYLLNFVENAEMVSESLVPNNSLIREFIGGSSIKY